MEATPIRFRLNLCPNPSAMGKLALTCNILIGFSLRLFNLGSDSFWNDEAGVILAALAPTIKGVVQVARTHAMAMPLDYLLIWVARQISLNEFVLRLPSAIFGTTTILVCFRLFRRLTGERVALTSGLLLALSPLHIHYSQELRFYSALVFFYFLSTELLFEAIEHPSGWKWIIFTFIATTGIYFHVYVSLSLVNGVVWIVLYRNKLKLNCIQIKYLCGSILTLSVAFLLGYVYFGSHQNFNYKLLIGNTPLLEEIGLGLGWVELPYVAEFSLGDFWYFACFGFAVIGIIVAILHEKESFYVVLISGLAQVGLVITADVYKGYWFNYRQVIHLLPFALLLSSMGVISVGEWLSQFDSSRQQHRGSLLLVFALLLLSIPSLANYYHWPKSTARQISAFLSENWSEGDVVLVVPGYNEKIFRYYLQYVFNKPEIALSVKSTELEVMMETKDVVRNKFLILINDFEEVDFHQLNHLGFKPAIISHRDIWLGQSLYISKGIQ